MFFGTTPQIISQFLLTEIETHKPARAFIPFAGNFVVEQLVGMAGRGIEIHSTDISLYSRAIGYGLASAKSEIKVKASVFETFPILEKYTSPEQIAVAMIFLTDVSKAIDKAPKIRYYASILRDAVDNVEKYLQSIEAKFEKVKSTVGDNFKFYGIDGIEVCKMVEKNDFVFYDPPVILGDYEKMFSSVEKMFDFDEPEYTQMDEEVKRGNLVEFQDKKAICYYRVNNPIRLEDIGYSEVFRYKYKHNAYYCVYTNRVKSRFAGSFKALKEEVKHYPIIMFDDEITEKSEIDIVPCTGNVGNHYRLMWVKKALMTNGGHPYLIFVDKKLIGMTQLSDGVEFGSDLVAIFSDPAAPTSRYKRLSKLILYLVCTTEMLDIMNERTMWEHNGFTTRVFTNAAVSMKYRSLFTISSRKEDDGANHKYCIIYQNRDKILPTFKDGLIEWLKKDAKVTKVAPKKEIK